VYFYRAGNSVACTTGTMPLFHHHARGTAMVAHLVFSELALVVLVSRFILTWQGVITPKLQLLSGHAEEKSLAKYRALALADVAEEYEAAMRHSAVDPGDREAPPAHPGLSGPAGALDGGTYIWLAQSRAAAEERL
jgi:hypothetical protein